MSRSNTLVPVEGTRGPLLGEEALQFLGGPRIGGPGGEQIEPALAPEHAPLTTLQTHPSSNLSLAVPIEDQRPYHPCPPVRSHNAHAISQ